MCKRLLQQISGLVDPPRYYYVNEGRSVGYLAPLILLDPASRTRIQCKLTYSFIHSVKGPVDQLYTRIHYDGYIPMDMMDACCSH